MPYSHHTLEELEDSAVLRTVAKLALGSASAPASRRVAGREHPG